VSDSLSLDRSIRVVFSLSIETATFTVRHWKKNEKKKVHDEMITAGNQRKVFNNFKIKSLISSLPARIVVKPSRRDIVKLPIADAFHTATQTCFEETFQKKQKNS
jgi:hypothetical protein